MTSENERIKKIRKESLGYSLEKFGKCVGVTRAAMSNIESGTRGVTDQMRRSICREFGVNEKWLRDGTGSMFNESNEEEELQKLADLVMGDAPGSFRRRLISVMARLNDDQWEALAEISDMLAKESTERSLADREKDAEEEYIKKSSGSARSTDTNVLNSTEDAM